MISCYFLLSLLVISSFHMECILGIYGELTKSIISISHLKLIIFLSSSLPQKTWKTHQFSNSLIWFSQSIYCELGLALLLFKYCIYFLNIFLKICSWVYSLFCFLVCFVFYCVVGRQLTSLPTKLLIVWIT